MVISQAVDPWIMKFVDAVVGKWPYLLVAVTIYFGTPAKERAGLLRSLLQVALRQTPPTVADPRPKEKP
jgi:hypothetical protein